MMANDRGGPRKTNPAPSKVPHVIAVAGGKGGVGKSVLAVNLAVMLARLGKRTVLLDGDLGGANADALLGCERPPRNLGHFFASEVTTLGALAVSTCVERLALIAGDTESLGAANPAHTQKQKLIRHIRMLDCDVVVVDLGAGTSFNTLDLYLAADVGLTVTTPEPTAVQNCFAFIKAATLRDLEKRTGEKRRDNDRSLHHLVGESGEARAALDRTTRLVVNRTNAGEARRVTNMLHDLASRFLNGRVALAATISDDPCVAQSVRRMTPLCHTAADSSAAQDVARLAVALSTPSHSGTATLPLRGGVNEEIEFGGCRLHLQTEDLGNEQSAVVTHIFMPNGGVAYTRRTPYLDSFFVKLNAAPADRVRLHHVAIRRALEQGRILLQQAAA